MNGKEFTVSEVIDSFGINGHTWLMFVLLGLANIFDGYDFMIVNSTNTYLAPSFGLQTAAQASSTACSPCRRRSRPRWASSPSGASSPASA